MQVKNPELFTKLERMAAHYKNNVASTYLKAEFGSLALSRRDWEEVELITARQDVFRQQGYHLDELYLKLLSLARLVQQARAHLAPNLKTLVANRFGSRPGPEKLMAEMSVANFVPNLGILSSMILDLYDLTKREDADQNQGKTKALGKVPEAKEIETLLAP